MKVQSQSVISGNVKDENNKNLNGATLIIQKDSLSGILAYAISDKNGNFSLQVNSPADSLFLKTSYMGYATKRQVIKNQDQQVEVILNSSSEELKQVIVEANMLEQRGDTLSFSVAAFKGKEDRVIADVLKKIPGIEILPSGQIRYKGEPIQKYYIEGLDLLEGRYNLANENLNANAVSKVEILENHQPIKVLDSLEFSERASLNIKLKKEVTLTGTAEIGSGLSPFLWQVKLTPMIFTKERQALITYQSNNTGRDVSREIRDFSFNLFSSEFSLDNSEILSLSELTEPSFDTERWLDNNAHLASVNFLERLDNDLDLKANISYLNDNQLQQGSNTTRFFTPTDTVDLLEVTSNRFYTNSLQPKFTLERNTDKRFLKNQLEMRAYWDSSRGVISRTDDRIEQDLNSPFRAIRNNFQLLSPVGKQLIEFRSVIGYSDSRQELEVKPGQFEDLVNEGNTYANSRQQVNETQFFADNSAGFTKGLGNFSLSPKLGIQFSNTNLESALDGGLNADNDQFRNDLQYFSNSLYLENSIRYKSDDESWNLRLGTDLSYRDLKAEMSYERDNQELQKLVFEPQLFVRKKLSAFWETTLFAGLNYDFGNVQRLYRGFILTNYRRLQNYDSPISENQRQNYRLGLNYRNPLKQFFVNGSYSYIHNKSNLLYSSFITENGASLNQALETDNYSRTHSYDLGLSQYFTSLHTTLKLNGNYRLTDREQLLNEALSEIQNKSYSAGLSLDSEITEWLSVNYDGTLAFFDTYINDQKVQHIRTGSHFLKLFFFPADNQYLNISGELYDNSVNQNTENYFMNLNYTYNFEESGIDLSLSWNNILNTDSFSNVYSSEFSYVESTYRLRPSQVLLSLKFSL
ncbi:carboxypeptidase-like regulatory domain-containing protein [Gramella sp. GC03-9]|uniref:Carboxypeptidase-like regulatory domain-containing protein n=1 Tax=Christiangramia oceanisediminis TaxID=2920386 RepID=A0A9X2I7G3_9FLAO|nr:carboxypeptidase-like regulatory domain-containing protein [Gramella oceanisediminis]MCP9198906.1 carboxypeptidase-like regulatory domain-containing protein [Gramella oceanisediminis]